MMWIVKARKKKNAGAATKKMDEPAGERGEARRERRSSICSVRSVRFEDD